MKRRLMSSDAATSAAAAAAAATPAAAAAAADAAPADGKQQQQQQQRQPKQQQDDAEMPRHVEGAVVVRPDDYERQLEAKVARVRALFAESGQALPAVEVRRSVRSHYRQRAEFRVWHRGGGADCHYIMFARPPGAKAPVRYRVDDFPVGSHPLNALMAAVMDGARADGELRRKLYQVNIHTTLAGDAMVTMVYHRALGDDWRAAAARLRAELRAALERAAGEAEAAAAAAAAGGGAAPADDDAARAAAELRAAAGGALHVIGRSLKQKVALDEDFVTERLVVNGRELVYK